MLKSLRIKFVCINMFIVTLLLGGIFGVLPALDSRNVEPESVHSIHIGVLIAAALLLFLGISILLARWAVRPVEKAWQQQKQFIADASHELKTPLTVILTNAELLQSPAYEKEQKKRFAENILVMTGQMRGLVESMLELARADRGSRGTPFETVQVSDTVTNAILPFEPLFFEKGLRLDTEIEGGIELKGRKAGIKQLAEILLDNAQKYTPEGGTVLVGLKSVGHHRCQFSVANTGEALSGEELKNIFKRFYRLDGAGSMRHGYGLGLSIALGIVRQHHGKLWAESRDGQNIFLAELPVRKPRGS